MAKHKRVLSTKLKRDFKAKRGQFIAIMVTIFLGMMLFASSYDAYQNLLTSYNTSFINLRMANFTVTGGSVNSIYDEGSQISGVETSETRYQADIPFDVGDDIKFVGRMVGMTPDRQPIVNKVEMLEGEYLSSDNPSGVIADVSFAENQDLKVGSKFNILASDVWKEVEVIGIATSAEYIWPARSNEDPIPTPDNFGVVYANNDTTRKFGDTQAIRQAMFYYDDANENQSIDDKLIEISKQNKAGDWFDRSKQPSNHLLELDIQGFGAMAVFFPVLFLGAAILASYVLLTRLVTQQRRIVGMMRASGMSQHEVFRHYIGYGLRASIIGTLLGLIAGFGVGVAISYAYTGIIDIPYTVINVHWEVFAIGIVLGLLTGVVSAYVPARKSARLDPAEAMRGITESGASRKGLLEKIIPFSSKLKSRTTLTLRSLSRNWKRTASTVLGVVISIVLILVSWGMIDTMLTLIDEQFDVIQKDDAIIYFEQSVDKSSLAAVDKAGGVKDSEIVAQYASSISNDSNQFQTSLTVFDQDTRMHVFIDPEGNAITLPGTGILINQSITSEFSDMDIGGVVTINIPSIDRSFETSVAGFVNEAQGTPMYTSFEYLDSQTNNLASKTANSVFVQFDAGANHDELRTELSTLPGVVSYQDTSALKGLVDDYLGFFYVFVGIMLLLGGIMAFALIFTIMSVNITERHVDFGSMRANGMSIKEIARMITLENMLATFIGILPGLLLGYLAAKAAMSMFSSTLFTFDLSIQTSTYIITAAVIIVAALFSQWPGIRGVKKLDIAGIIRERGE